MFPFPPRKSRKNHSSRPSGEGAAGRGPAAKLLLWIAIWAAPSLAAAASPPGQTEVPSPRESWSAAADSLFARGDMAGAAAAYQQLSKTHGDDADLWLRLAVANLALGKPGVALEAARSAQGLDPEGVDTYLVLGQCQAASGEPEAGLKTLSQGLAAHPEDRRLLETTVTLQLALDRWADAAGALRELIRLDPQHAGYRLDLGKILLSTGQLDPALESLEAARVRGADPAEVLALTAKGHLMQGKLDEAKKEYEQSLAIRRTAEALGGLGALAYLKGERGEATDKFRQALKLDPNDADLYFNLGNVLAQSDRSQEAEEAYRQSLRLDPRSASTHANLGVLLLNQLEVDAARTQLQQAIQLDPGLPGPYLHLARIAAATFDYDKSLDYYRSYQSRVEDPKEKARIDDVLTGLQSKIEETRQAQAKGEIHLLQLMVSDKAKAEAILQRLKGGADFFVVAQHESELADVAGVDAGFVDPEHLGPQFRNALVDLGVGKMTGVLQAPNGWYIFKRVQ